MKIKSIARRVIVVLYLGALLVSVLIVARPGASIFYYKRTINNQDIRPDTGYAYRFALHLSNLIFRTNDIMVYENGQPLIRSDDSTVIGTGANTYSLDEPAGEPVYVYLAPSDNSNPATNGRTYMVYIPLIALRRSMGLIYLAILLPGFAWFLYFSLVLRENRQRLLTSPKSITAILDQFFDHLSHDFRSENDLVRQRIRLHAQGWKNLFFVSILASYLYVLMEWVFFATKPSFMSMMNLPHKIEVFLLTGLGLSVLSFIALLILIALDIIGIFVGFSQFSRFFAPLIPTVELSAMVLLLVDNFTYIVFKFGIVTSTGVWRAVYAALFMLSVIIIYLQVLKLTHLGEEKSKQKSLDKRYIFTCLIVLAISIVLALTQFNYVVLTPTINNTGPQVSASMPNIILLGSDGLSAEDMSVYGYGRDTTPFIADLARDSLIAENAFPNAGTTAASEVSLLTSKLPTTTHFGLQFEKLSGSNAYQHLPGILKAAGYETIEYGVPTYMDSFAFNLQGGFDMVNDQTQSESKFASYLRKLGYAEPANFVDLMAGRIFDRIAHIFFISNMQNPYELVTHPASLISDQDKVNRMLSLLDQSKKPMFFHVHLLGTHGPKYNPSVQYYSIGETQDQPWMVDFYDDVIKSYDQLVGQVIDHLKQNGEFNNTILAIYTDHDKTWFVVNRIPLIMHFPGGQNAGKITANVQNMDIAPTLLDYLGLLKPDWMNGESLLNNKLDPQRLIFSAGTINLQSETSSGKVLSVEEQITPPFYQFSYFNVINCQKWYMLNLKTLQISSGEVTGYVAPCSVDSQLNLSQAKQAMIAQLTKDGYDTASIH